MLLYHGSNIVVEKPEIREKLRALDFGAGFYLTSSREQAIRWARTVTRRRRYNMSQVDARKLDFYDRQVAQLIIDKYGINEREAVRNFIESETYQMLLDVELDIYKMSPHIIFDMWESEKVTGDPRNSQYIRE